MRRDRKGKFKLATLQGKTASELLGAQKEAESLVLYENGKIYQYSAAVLRISRHLGGGWALLYGFMIIPRFIRDPLYKLIARNRYKWFGKKEQCRIPVGKEKERFLD